VPIEIAHQQAATDQIVFSNDGTALFAYDSISTDHALRKLAITPEGLVHVLTRSTFADSTLSDYATPHFAMLGANPMIGGRVFDGNDLMYKGQFGNSMTCIPLANGDKIACATGNSNTLDSLAVFSSGNYEALGTIESTPLPSGAKKLVKGPAGQIAMIVNDGLVAVGETNPIKLYLLGDPLLK
jgi:hypothetical protein